MSDRATQTATGDAPVVDSQNCLSAGPRGRLVMGDDPAPGQHPRIEHFRGTGPDHGARVATALARDVAAAE